MANQKHPYGYWTDERIIEESKKYKTPIEFKINAPTAYKKANFEINGVFLHKNI